MCTVDCTASGFRNALVSHSSWKTGRVPRALSALLRRYDSRRLHAFPPPDFAGGHRELLQQAALQHCSRHFAHRFAVSGKLRDGGEPIFPVKSVSEFIAYAKANTGKINMGASGPGSSSQLYGELFKTMTGIEMAAVQYRGVGSALPDLMSGRLDVTLTRRLRLALQKSASSPSRARPPSSPVSLPSKPKSGARSSAPRVSRRSKLIAAGE